MNQRPLVALLEEARLCNDLETRNRFYDACYRRLSPSVLFKARRLNERLAEDLTAQAFLRILMADLPRLKMKTDTELKRYMLKIVYHEWVNAYYKHFWESPEEEPSRHPNQMPEEENKEIGIRLHRQMKRLPQKQYLVLSLFYLQEYSYQEITAKLNLKRHAVRNLIYRARNNLKNYLTPEPT